MSLTHVKNRFSSQHLNALMWFMLQNFRVWIFVTQFDCARGSFACFTMFKCHFLSAASNKVADFLFTIPLPAEAKK